VCDEAGAQLSWRMTSALSESELAAGCVVCGPSARFAPDLEHTGPTARALLEMETPPRDGGARRIGAETIARFDRERNPQAPGSASRDDDRIGRWQDMGLPKAFRSVSHNETHEP